MRRSWSPEGWSGHVPPLFGFPVRRFKEACR
jgi:hypothetical protein